MSGVSACRQTLAFPSSGLRLLLFPPLQADFPPPRGLKKDWTQNRASLLNCQAFNCSHESPGGDALKYRLVASVFLVVILAALFFSASRSKSRAEGPDVN